MYSAKFCTHFFQCWGQVRAFQKGNGYLLQFRSEWKTLEKKPQWGPVSFKLQ